MLTGLPPCLLRPDPLRPGSSAEERSAESIRRHRGGRRGGRVRAAREGSAGVSHDRTATFHGSHRRECSEPTAVARSLPPLSPTNCSQVAQAALAFREGIFRSTRQHAEQKQCWAPGGGTVSLASLPQLKHLFGPALEPVRRVGSFVRRCEERLCACLRAGESPPLELVEAIAVAKVGRLFLLSIFPRCLTFLGRYGRWRRVSHWCTSCATRLGPMHSWQSLDLDKQTFCSAVSLPKVTVEFSCRRWHETG